MTISVEISYTVWDLHAGLALLKVPQRTYSARIIARRLGAVGLSWG